MTDDDERQQGRVAKVLAELGKIIRPGTLPAFAAKVFADGETLTPAEISVLVRKALPEFEAAAKAPVPKNETAEQRLERINLEIHNAAKAAPPKVEQKVELTAEERERFTRWGAGALLEHANEKFRPITPPEVSDE